jgi:CRP/FNR family transcriptional regulator
LALRPASGYADEVPRPTTERLTGVSSSLRCCQLFSGLAAEDLTAIASFAVALRLAKGETLFHAGEASRGLFVVQAGAISVHRVNAAGKEQVIYVFRGGESFAEASLASPTGYPANARAIEPSTVLLIPKEPILALISRRPDLALRMLGSMSTHLRVLVGALEDLALKNVETRLLNWLIRHAVARAGQPPVATIPGTKRTLAAELGTSSETLSRTLGELRDRGWVTVAGRTIILQHQEALEARLQQNLAKG